MKNCSIFLRISHGAYGEKDETELFTRGEYRFHKGSYFIDYDETEATGYEGCHVQLRVDDKMVVMTRTGNSFTSLIFERGVRHYCQYGAEFGECMVGVSTSVLESALGGNGGEVNLKYEIDVNSGLVAENHIRITVKDVK